MADFKIRINDNLRIISGDIVWFSFSEVVAFLQANYAIGSVFVLQYCNATITEVMLDLMAGNPVTVINNFTGEFDTIVLQPDD